VIPGNGSNVLFDAKSINNLATVLDTSYNLASLAMNPSPSGSVSIGGTSTLTLTNGITLLSGLGQNLSITAPVALGAVQTWTNSGPGVLSVSNFSGSSALTLAGPGTVVLNGTNTTTGNNILMAGSTVKFAGPGSSSFPPSGTIYVLNNAGANGVGTIDLNGSTQTSTAYVSFCYSSTLTLTNGTLIDNAAATGVPDSHEDYNFMGTITLATNGNYISNKRFIIGLNSLWSGFTTTINGTGTNGSLTWGGDNLNNENYVGVTAGSATTLNINGGTVNFNNATFGTANGYLNVGANTATSKGTININGANMNVGTWMKLGGNNNTITGQSGTAVLTVTNGTVAIGGGSDATNNGVLFMDGGNGDATANTGTSTLSITNATLSVEQIQAGNNGTKTINLNGGTIVAGINASNLFMSVATGLTVNLQSGGATINSGTNSITIGSVLGSTGGLTKTGSGTLTLTNANTYSGLTTISAGTLTLTGSGSIANSTNITIGSGGTFDVSGLTTALALGSSQNLAASATGATTTGTLNLGSGTGLTLSAGGLTFPAYGGGSTAPLTLSGANSLALNGAPVTVTTTTAAAVRIRTTPRHTSNRCRRRRRRGVRIECGRNLLH